VEVGLNDGTYAEVLRGLNEGDRVVVEYQSTTQQQFGFGGPGMMVVVEGRVDGPPPDAGTGR
jgi:hypothetical protein